MKRILAFVIISTLLLGLVGCAEEEEKTIVIASKPMTEQFILVEMLTMLIEDQTDIKVEQKLGIGGGTSNIHPAMEKGDIDMYPEYTGTGWLFVLKEELINDPTELYEAVKASYEKEYAIMWSDLYGFNDTFGIAMKADLADSLGIKTYSDLAKHSKDLRFGAEYDFYEREDGYPGLAETYGFDFGDKVEMDISLKYKAIDEDQVDVINIFSTDGRLKEYGLVVLEDDMNFFPSYFAATLTRKDTLEKYPELEDVINQLAGQISNDEMITMNYEVEVNKRPAKEVAEEFLKEKGLK